MARRPNIGQNVPPESKRPGPTARNRNISPNPYILTAAIGGPFPIPVEKPGLELGPDPTRVRSCLSIVGAFSPMRFPRSLLAVAILSLTLLGGCRICRSCEDVAYPAYGGSWQRTVRDSGRVASLFDPAGAKGSALVSRDDPIEADEQNRRTRDPDDFDPEAAEAEDADDASDAGGKDDENLDDAPSLDDIEDEKSEKLKDLKLDEIEALRRVAPTIQRANWQR